MGRFRFAKGHGTGNDFVLLPDPDCALNLTPELVRALCDRRRGIGADGVLRIAASAKHPESASMADQADWFMDYWNADGSLAEMCGNGIRVFARYLVDYWNAPADDLAVATRSGVKQVRVNAVGVAADMGPPRFLGTSAAVVAGKELAGAGVSMGNPHLVCQLPPAEVDALDLSQPPSVDQAMFPDGVNVEFYALLGPSHLKLRVHERGVGETASCGTGVCAAAAVALRDTGQHTGEVTVDVPGGHLAVTVDRQTSWLAGPAVITAEGALTPQWLDLEHAD